VGRIPAADILFVVFAITFFASRLVYYPRYLLWTVLYVAASTLWGRWRSSALALLTGLPCEDAIPTLTTGRAIGQVGEPDRVAPDHGHLAVLFPAPHLAGASRLLDVPGRRGVLQTGFVSRTGWRGGADWIRSTYTMAQYGPGLDADRSAKWWCSLL
jgi:hypothetical protein